VSKKNGMALAAEPIQLSTAQVVAFQVLMEQKNDLERQLARVVQRLTVVMEEAGLTPSVVYDISDDGRAVAQGA
jgi:hypothetical protein